MAGDRHRSALAVYDLPAVPGLAQRLAEAQPGAGGRLSLSPGTETLPAAHYLHDARGLAHGQSAASLR
ncbi:hypothetical protein D3981_004224 [Escherichia coli]|nr:hypothetical protein [Escherichia coli]